MYSLNIKSKIAKLENILELWRRRNLTVNGHMLIVKTFALSQLVYVAQVMPLHLRDIKIIENLSGVLNVTK